MESGVNFGPGVGVVGPPIVLGHESYEGSSSRKPTFMVTW
jgi:hypothetical protein